MNQQNNLKGESFMKHLITLSLLVLMTACNGAGGGEKEADVTEPNNGIDIGTCLDQNNNVISCTSNSSPLIISYNSNGAYQNTGRSLDLMRAPDNTTDFDENRPLIIPQFITRLQDSANSLQINDIARIQFVYVACDYKWNGTQFAFWRCIDVLSTPTYAVLASNLQHGDTLYLHDVAEPSNPGQDGKIQFGVVRNPAANHTGTIDLQASLQ
jgi:hypothetical protein